MNRFTHHEYRGEVRRNTAYDTSQAVFLAWGGGMLLVVVPVLVVLDWTSWRALLVMAGYTLAAWIARMLLLPRPADHPDYPDD